MRAKAVATGFAPLRLSSSRAGLLRDASTAGGQGVTYLGIATTAGLRIGLFRLRKELELSTKKSPLVKLADLRAGCDCTIRSTLKTRAQAPNLVQRASRRLLELSLH